MKAEEAKTISERGGLSGCSSTTAVCMGSIQQLPSSTNCGELIK